LKFESFYFTEDKNLPILLLLIGIPGSGKSTWLKSFDQTNYIIINPDSIRKEITGDISDVSQDVKVWQIAKERTVNALENGKNVILDATNVDTSRRREFINDLPEVQIQAKLFDADPEESKRRIRKDIELGIDRSNVPEEIIDKMYDKYKYTLTKIKEEPIEIIS
jgi:predicted kinase